MSAPSPRVSVVMPVYNAGRPLRAAVESILGQTFTDFELIAVNDGSTDGSGQVLDAYAAGDPRVRVIHQENCKQVATMNRAIAEARGDLIARMDADDRSYPERLAKQVAYLDKHPEVGVLGTHADVSFPDREEVWGSFAGHTLLRWHLLSTTPMIHPSVMMRAMILRAAGGYAPAAERLEDYELFYRLSNVTRLATLTERLVWYNRTEETNISTVYFENQQRVARDIHAQILASYDLNVPTDVLDGYSRLAFIGEQVLSEPEWTTKRVEKVARLMWQLAVRFINRFDTSQEERNVIWGEVNARMYALARHHGQLTGYPTLSNAMRLVWAPKLSLWSLSGRRAFL